MIKQKDEKNSFNRKKQPIMICTYFPQIVAGDIIGKSLYIGDVCVGEIINYNKKTEYFVAKTTFDILKNLNVDKNIINSMILYEKSC